jgi:acetyl-CoA carboxylase carboxyltransferase component
MVKSKKDGMQIGGVIYTDSADKSARFIMNCNQRNIPLVFLQDVTGFMVGSRSEQAGIIKDGAKMVNAQSNSVVPKFTIILGNSYGAGNYAMCGKAYDPRLIVGWPTSQVAVMGGAQAAKVLLQIELFQILSEQAGTIQWVRFCPISNKLAHVFWFLRSLKITACFDDVATIYVGANVF